VSSARVATPSFRNTWVRRVSTVRRVTNSCWFLFAVHDNEEDVGRAVAAVRCAA
jgi:hypothetical protein